jgi:succinate dehydrogenase / fumarate reductase iron-sulfur subunit
MNIDRHNGLACLTPISSLKKGTSRITPLPNMKVLKDSVPDLIGLFAQYELIEPWLQSDQPPPDREHRHSQEERAQVDGLWECILCFCCSTSWTAISVRQSCCSPTACSPTAALSAPASGSIGSTTFRLYRCHTIMNCTKACPKGLNPARAITITKRMMVERE